MLWIYVCFSDRWYWSKAGCNGFSINGQQQKTNVHNQSYFVKHTERFQAFFFFPGIDCFHSWQQTQQTFICSTKGVCWNQSTQWLGKRGVGGAGGVHTLDTLVQSSTELDIEADNCIHSVKHMVSSEQGSQGHMCRGSLSPLPPPWRAKN